MQAEPQTQLTPLPPEPHCVVWYSSSPCDVLKQQYQQALAQRQQEELQLYVARQKAGATAPLQQQIADQQVQIKKLQGQVQTQAMAAFQSKAAAHDEGFWHGAIAGIAV